jgi:hypothetical protein
VKRYGPRKKRGQDVGLKRGGLVVTWPDGEGREKKKEARVGSG